MNAALDLVVEEQVLPTAQAIAERAGLAKRSVFHHFTDLDELLSFAAATQATRHWSLLERRSPDLPLGGRIESAVTQRSALFEAIGDVRRVAVAYESQSATLAGLLKRSRVELRRHLDRHLDPEIRELDQPAVDGIHAVASWEAWETLRRHQGLHPRAARAAVTSTIQSAMERCLSKEI